MTIRDDLAEVPPGTRVRLIHSAGAKQRSTSGILVSISGDIVRVLPPRATEEIGIDVSAISRVSALDAPERPSRAAVILRMMTGAILFGAVGFHVGVFVRFAGAELWVALVIVGGSVLGGAVAGFFASGIVNPKTREAP